MTPEDYIRLRNAAKALARTAEEYWDRTVMPKQSDLRPATFEDLRPGVVIYYFDPEPRWEEVETVHGDYEFKAYTSYSGCRYGLENAYVRKT